MMTLHGSYVARQGFKLATPGFVVRHAADSYTWEPGSKTELFVRKQTAINEVVKILKNNFQFSKRMSILPLESLLPLFETCTSFHFLCMSHKTL